MNFIKLFSILSTTLIFSCTVTQKDKFYSQNKAEMTAQTWTLESIKNKVYEAQMPKHPNLVLNIPEKYFSGNDGCNSIFGKIEKYNDTDIEFSEIAGTRIYCEDTEVSDKYVTLLGKVKHYEITKKSLLLKDAENRIVLKFDKEPHKK